MIKVIIPRQLRKISNSSEVILIGERTLPSVFLAIQKEQPLLASQILHKTGEIRSFVALFYNGEQVSLHDSEEFLLEAGGELEIVMSVAGG